MGTYDIESFNIVASIGADINQVCGGGRYFKYALRVGYLVWGETIWVHMVKYKRDGAETADLTQE